MFKITRTRKEFARTRNRDSSDENFRNVGSRSSEELEEVIRAHVSGLRGVHKCYFPLGHTALIDYFLPPLSFSLSLSLDNTNNTCLRPFSYEKNQ